MRSSSKKFKVSIIVLVLILAIFCLNLFSKQTRAFFYSISSPFQKVLWRTGDKTSDFLESIFNAKNLKKEAEQFKFKNQEQLAEITALRNLKEENEFLREALGIELQKEFELSLAQIIGKNISQDYLLIDKGSNSGISKDMPVITQQKAVVGRIGEVYKNFSKVMLISGKESSFDIEIQEKDASGIAKGKGNFKLFIDLLPREKDFSQGDIIITSSLGGIFPSGLLVGGIAEIKRNDVESFQEAEVNSAFNIEGANYLLVITKY